MSVEPNVLQITFDTVVVPSVHVYVSCCDKSTSSVAVVPEVEPVIVSNCKNVPVILESIRFS